MALARQNGALGDYYDTRAEVIREYHRISERIAFMRMYGRASWSYDDYQLCYAIKSGVFKLPKGSLWDPAQYNTEASNGAAIQRGFFNVKRWYTPLRDGSRLRIDNDPFPDMPTSAVSDQPEMNLAQMGIAGSWMNQPGLAALHARGQAQASAA